MKTITLNDEAYRRLLEWKRTPRDSFSHVVLTVVPRRGTLGQMLDGVGALPPQDDNQMKVMEEAVEWGADPKGLRDQWTS